MNFDTAPIEDVKKWAAAQSHPDAADEGHGQLTDDEIRTNAKVLAAETIAHHVEHDHAGIVASRGARNAPSKRSLVAAEFYAVMGRPVTDDPHDFGIVRDVMIEIGDEDA